MLGRRLCFVLLLAIACVAAVGQEVKPEARDAVVRLPESVEAKVGELVIVKAECSSHVEFWVDERLGGQGAYYIDYANKTIVLPTPGEGTYLLLAWTADQSGKPSRAARCIVKVVGGPRPPGPGPSPGPGPAPVPDAFLFALQNAMRVDAAADATAGEKLKLLISLYRNAAVTIVQEQQLKTVGDFLMAMQRAARLLLADSDLQSVRRAIADELNRRITHAASVPLTDEIRKAIARELARVAQTLEKL